MVPDNMPPGRPGRDAGKKNGSSAQNAGDPIRVLLEQMGALTSYTGHLAQAKVDVVKLRVRRLYARALATLVAVLVIAAAATTGTIYAVHGTALVLAEAFGGRSSLGYLLAGLTCVVVVIGVSMISMRLAQMRRRDEIVDKYEQRKAIERSRHGRDVDQATGEAA